MKTSVTLARSPFGLALTGALALAVCCISCSRTTRDAREDTNLTEAAYYQELYRPQYHFSPENTWTNDPNGLLWYDGEYHLFYQNNPFGDRWGHMSWGHAVSPDLLHWEHLSLAIPEEGNEMIFSGSAVVDYVNRSGLCGEGTGDCMVAIYTSHISQGDTSHQYQSLAFSSDRGRTWRKYEGNPVLDLGMRDFRDPKVFWHEPSARWVMVVSLPQQHTVQIYNSANLTEWSLQSEFGRQGDTSMIWECPDLLEVPVEGGGSRWVLIISSGSRHPGVVGMQYFVGEFDGRQFRLNEPHPAPRWVDYGKDFYAAVTFNQLPAGEAPVLLGWANSWTYANDIPTTPWRGVMSIPRRLSLRAGNTGLELVQVPVLDGSGSTQDLQLDTLYGEGEFEVEGDLELGDLRGGSLVIRLRMQRENASDFGIRVLAGEGEETAIGYDSGIASLYFDRTRSGRSDFHPAFASRELLPMELEEGGRLNLLILVDRSLIEVFAEGGSRVMTGQVFPTNTQQAVQLYARGGQVMVESLEVFGVESAWKAPGN
jgi:fructan beta-fructosidase